MFRSHPRVPIPTNPLLHPEKFYSIRFAHRTHYTVPDSIRKTSCSDLNCYWNALRFSSPRDRSWPGLCCYGFLFFNFFGGTTIKLEIWRKQGRMTDAYYGGLNVLVARAPSTEGRKEAISAISDRVPFAGDPAGGGFGCGVSYRISSRCKFKLVREKFACLCLGHGSLKAQPIKSGW